MVDCSEEAVTAEDSSRPPGRPTVVPEFKQRVGSMCIFLAVDQGIDRNRELVDHPADRDACFGRGLQFPNVFLVFFL